MAFVYFDRVKVVSATTGTGSITLGAAVTAFRTFASVYADTDTMYYCITDQAGANWEVGLGTYNSGVNTLTRGVTASSNANALVNFTSGALYVFTTIAALQLLQAGPVNTGSGNIVLANGPQFTGSSHFIGGSCDFIGTSVSFSGAGFNVNMPSGNIALNTGFGNLLCFPTTGSIFLQPGTGEVRIGPTVLGNVTITPATSLVMAPVVSGTMDNVSIGVTTPASGKFTNIIVSTPAGGLTLKQGANGKCGTLTLTGTTVVTVTNTSIAVTDVIMYGVNTPSGTVGAVPTTKTITAATGFTVAGSVGDISLYNYVIISNAA